LLPDAPDANKDGILDKAEIDAIAAILRKSTQTNAALEETPLATVVEAPQPTPAESQPEQTPSAITRDFVKSLLVQPKAKQ
jgi:hypothetical protein